MYNSTHNSVLSNYCEDFSVIETTTNQTLNNHCFDAFPQPSVKKINESVSYNFRCW